MFHLPSRWGVPILLLVPCLATPAPGQQPKSIPITINYVIYSKVLCGQMEGLLQELARGGDAAARRFGAELATQREAAERINVRARGYQGRKLTQEEAAAVKAHNEECKKVFNSLLRAASAGHFYLRKTGRQPHELLKTLADGLVKSKKFDPTPDGKTRCNLFANAFAQTAHGYNGFKDRKANQCVNLLRSGKDHWNVIRDPDPRGTGKPVPLDRAQMAKDLASAQDLANKGYLVVVAWKDNRPITPQHKETHGHIAVVVPGNLDQTDAKNPWGMKVPWVAQAGGYVKENNKPKLDASGKPIPNVFARGMLNRGFGPHLMGEIVIYVRKP